MTNAEIRVKRYNMNYLKLGFEVSVGWLPNLSGFIQFYKAC